MNESDIIILIRQNEAFGNLPAGRSDAGSRLSFFSPCD